MLAQNEPPKPLLMRDVPESDRPRERLKAVGERAVSTTELLAIQLRTGSGGESVNRLAERLLSAFDGLPGLAKATINELISVKGIGPAKAVEIKAALELGRRLLATTPDERPQITSPADAANLLISEMGPARTRASSRHSNGYERTRHSYSDRLYW